MLVIGLLCGLYAIWRKGREEHYDEMLLFDGVFGSLLLSLLISRVAYIFINPAQFGLDLVKWVDIFNNPGFSLFVLFGMTAFLLMRYSKKKKWDVFEILDFWSLGAALSLVFVWIGYFMSGAIIGTETALPWGVQFPTVFTKNHPVQLYFALFYAFLYSYLHWAEYNYRFFQWYRHGKKTAQTGFLTSVFIIANGVMIALASFVTLPALQFGGIRVDILVGIALTIFGIGLLYTRSGRTLPLGIGAPKKKNTKLQDFSV